MSDFQRFAVYYLPEDAGLATFGARWLGWDVVAGAPVEHFDVEGIADVTATPRKYGFHGTLKPPFRLADGSTLDGLQSALAGFAAKRSAFQIDGLSIARIGHFLALVPMGSVGALARLAFACVTELDLYRRPADDTELARRRSAGLTPRQDDLLVRWGYPYVGEEFRFHLTLSGKLGPERLDHVATEARRLMPPLPRPFRMESVALVGERPEGMFQLIQRYALTG